jgi:hypothetical protein
VTVGFPPGDQLICWCLFHGLGRESEAELVERLLLEELDCQPPWLTLSQDSPRVLPQPGEDESG